MSKPAGSLTRSYLLLTLAVAIWGANFVATKYLLLYLPPLTQLLLRLPPGVALLGLLAWRWRMLEPVSRRTLPWLLLSGLLVVVVNNNLFMIGVNYTNPANASMVMALTPLATAVIATRLAGERLRALQWLGIALSFGGVGVLIFHGSLEAMRHVRVNPGDLIMLGAMLAWAAHNVVLRRVTAHMNPLSAAFWFTLFGTGIALPLNYALEGFGPQRPLDAGFWLLMLFTAVGATALANLWWARGIQHLGAARAAIFMNGVPLFSVLAAAVFLHEPVTAAHAVGFVLIVAGVRMGTTPPGGGAVSLPAAR